LSEFHNFLNFRVKPAAYDACFPAELLAAGSESCHRIGCDAISVSQYNGKILI